MAQRMIGLQIDEDLRNKIISFQEGYGGTHTTNICLVILTQKQTPNLAGIKQKLQSFCLAQPVFHASLVLTQSAQNGLMLMTVPGKLNMFYERLSSYLGAQNAPKLFRASLPILSPTGGVDIPSAFNEAKKIFPKPIAFTVDRLALYEAERERQPFELVEVFEFTGR